jgi:hypothetical protein
MTISDGFFLGVGIMMAVATLIAVIAVIGLLIDVCQRTKRLFPVGNYGHPAEICSERRSASSALPQN